LKDELKYRESCGKYDVYARRKFQILSISPFQVFLIFDHENQQQPPFDYHDILSQKLVYIDIVHAYQGDNCGNNELILVVVDHVIVEKQVCRVGP
jgi:hypothetical protein